MPTLDGVAKLHVEASAAPRYVQSTAGKLKEDCERRAVTRAEQCKWQRPAEARAAGAEQRLANDVSKKPPHAGIVPFLAQALPQIGLSCSPHDLHVERLSLPRVAARGTDTCLVHAPDESRDGRMVFVLKAGDREAIRSEARCAAWAMRALGSARVPQLLLPEPVLDGSAAAFAAEFVGFGGQRLGRSSLHDHLLLGAGRFALEDLRALGTTKGEIQSPSANGAQLPVTARFAAEASDVAGIRWLAKQAAEVLQVLREQPVEVALQAGGGSSPNSQCNAVADSLFGLLPLLERHLLQAHRPTTSPLHPSVRALTEAHYAASFGGGSPAIMHVEVLERATRLRSRLQDLQSAERRGVRALPAMSVPLLWSHGRFTARHLLLRESGDPRGPEMNVSSWGGLLMAPPYRDLAHLLTSLALETVRLPLHFDDVASLYDAPGDHGFAPPAQVCAHHLQISERAADGLLGLAAERRCRSLPELISVAEEAAASSDAVSDGDLARLLAWVRHDPASMADAAGEARKIGEALCDWTLPRSAVRASAGARGPVPRVAPPPKSRPRGDVPIRAMQWGWQVVREFREAAAQSLPVVEGDVQQLWPALWLVPNLQLALELLDGADCPFPQKVWMLHYVGCLSDRLLSWLDSTTRDTAPKSLEIRLIKE